MEVPLSAPPGGRTGLQEHEGIPPAGAPFRSGTPQGLPTRGDFGPGVQCYLPIEPTGGPGATLDGTARSLTETGNTRRWLDDLDSEDWKAT